MYHSALVSYSLRASGPAGLGPIQTPNGFSACPKILVEWEHGLASSAHLSALGGRRNMQDAGSPYDFSLHFLFFFLVYSHLLMP